MTIRRVYFGGGDCGQSCNHSGGNEPSFIEGWQLKFDVNGVIFDCNLISGREVVGGWWDCWDFCIRLCVMEKVMDSWK